jgi:streptomycin 6-kinase
MSSTSHPSQSASPAHTMSEVFRTTSERLALEEHARAERRRLSMAEQRSDDNPADIRIRAWEKLHGLRMPSDPTHQILHAIVRGTRLTLAQVQEVQCKRAAQQAAGATKQNPSG